MLAAKGKKPRPQGTRIRVRPEIGGKNSSNAEIKDKKKIFTPGKTSKRGGQGIGCAARGDSERCNQTYPQRKMWPEFVFVLGTCGGRNPQERVVQKIKTRESHKVVWTSVLAK